MRLPAFPVWKSRGMTKFLSILQCTVQGKAPELKLWQAGWRGTRIEWKNRKQNLSLMTRHGNALFQLKTLPWKALHAGITLETLPKFIPNPSSKNGIKKIIIKNPFYHRGRYAHFFAISYWHYFIVSFFGNFFCFSWCILLLLRIIFQIDFLMKKHTAKILYVHCCGPVVLWRCGAVALWRCGAVALWRCGAVALWRCGVALWRCGGIEWLYVAYILCWDRWVKSREITRPTGSGSVLSACETAAAKVAHLDREESVVAWNRVETYTATHIFCRDKVSMDASSMVGITCGLTHFHNNRVAFWLGKRANSFTPEKPA